MISKSKKILKDLINSISPSGYEGPLKYGKRKLQYLPIRYGQTLMVARMQL